MCVLSGSSQTASHIDTLVPTVSRVSNTWQAFLVWQSSVHVPVMLILTQWFRLFLFCYIGCCWFLHGVAVFKSKVLHKHVNVSGIVLIHDSSLSPVQPPVQRFDALRRPIADDLRFDGIHTRHLPLELHQAL